MDQLQHIDEGVKKKKKSTAGEKSERLSRSTLAGCICAFSQNHALAPSKVFGLLMAFASPFRAGGGGDGMGCVAGLSISRPTHSAGLDATLPPLPSSSPPRSQPPPSVHGRFWRCAADRERSAAPPGLHQHLPWQCALSLCSQEMMKVQPVFLSIYLISFRNQ